MPRRNPSETPSKRLDEVASEASRAAAAGKRLARPRKPPITGHYQDTPVTSVGSRLTELRIRCNFSQAMVAEAVGASRGAYRQWEGNVTTPELSKIEALSVYLQTTPEYIAFGIYKLPDEKYVAVVPSVDLNHTGHKIKIGDFGFPTEYFRKLSLLPDKAEVIRLIEDKNNRDVLFICDTSVKKIDRAGDYIIKSDQGVELLRVRNIVGNLYIIGEDCSVPFKSDGMFVIALAVGKISII